MLYPFCVQKLYITMITIGAAKKTPNSTAAGVNPRYCESLASGLGRALRTGVPAGSGVAIESADIASTVYLDTELVAPAKRAPPLTPLRLCAEHLVEHLQVCARVLLRTLEVRLEGTLGIVVADGVR